MSRYAQYHVVSASSTKELEHEVFVLLQGRWKLVGGIAVICQPTGHKTFYQALTKGGKSA